MFKLKLKPNLLEKIEATRQNAKWEQDVAWRIAESKERARDEDLAEVSHIKVYTDRSRIDGQIGAAAVLYHDGCKGNC